MDEAKIIIYYDGGCPFCSRYVQYHNFTKSHPNSLLVDVRDDEIAYQKLNSLGFNIDNSMVVLVNDQYYTGGDAIHIMSLLSTRSSMLNKINRSIFSSKILSRILYPVLKFFRDATISILRKDSIENKHNKNNFNKTTMDAFSIFSFTWGIYALTNFFYMHVNYLNYPEKVSPLTSVLPFVAIL